MRMQTLLFTLQLCLALASPKAFSADNRSLIQRIEARAVETGSDSLMIIENGKLLYKNNFGHEEKLQSVQSATKSVCAIAIAVLLDQGKISSVDQKMSDWIPEWASHQQKSKITLKMIMSMMSGLPNDPAIHSSSDYIEFAKNAELEAEPGTKFIYSAVGSALLQLVIAKSSGMSLDQFVEQVLFKPLGITQWSWVKDQYGHEATGGGLFLVPSDLAKIGEMMLNRGVYRGQKILSSRSQEIILKRSQKLEDYALLWWLNLEGEPGSDFFRFYYAAGWGGQYIGVFPEKNLVVVRTRDPKTMDGNTEPQYNFSDFADLVSQWQ